MIKGEEYRITDTLAPSIAKEPLASLAKTFDAFTMKKVELDSLLLWAAIDRVREEILDHFAYHLHVDGYDISYPIKIKCEMVKKSFLIHKHRGTAYAVKTTIATVYDSANLEEWFQYGGGKYCFRVSGITAPLTGAADLQRLVSLINESKNIRSWLDYVQFERKVNATEYIGCAVGIAKNLIIDSDFSTTLSIGLTEYAGMAVAHAKTITINTTLNNDV